jgi:signal transduction histidine kinase/ActR/RegA family two-component response regulator
MTPSTPAEPARSVEMRVLVWPPTRADANAIVKLLEAAGMNVCCVDSLRELCAAITAGAATALLAEEALLPDTAPLIDVLSRQPVWSDLPLLILSRPGRESGTLARLMSELGNVSIIERPVRTSTLLSLIRSSQRARARQYDVREHFAERERAEAEREQLLKSERAARSEAERASRMKDEFLATLSHELRTPLHAVLGWTQVLRRSPGLTPDIAKGLGTIERSARSQAQIIEQLLDMSSIISGKVRLDLQAVDPTTIVNATVETVRPTAQAKDLDLQCILDPCAGPVRGDPNRLQQILWNLLTNAVKFTPRGGRVLLKLTRADNDIELEVEDNGEGIDPGFLPHVFDRFRQADASITRSHGGLGLGLSIVKQLVELHGGRIAAHSAGRGTGSSFRVTLPVLPLADQALAAEESPRGHVERPRELPLAQSFETAGLKGLSILIVDDEPDARVLIQRFLEEYGANVTHAGSTAEALSSMDRCPPDVLVSDIGMPGQDGYALIRQVRALGGAYSRIPAIALTAYARTEDRAKAMGAGYQSHLSKPVEPIELLATIRSLRSRYAAEEERRG